MNKGNQPLRAETHRWDVTATINILLALLNEHTWTENFLVKEIDDRSQNSKLRKIRAKLHSIKDKRNMVSHG